ncbi:tRNA glutamyl-Q(34) synthetase GluQRS [Glaciecola punicea]|jgi:glutamyl-Q tRNA(Asp) synthetase|uniref:tRNA glutamyl-Q(34) synthetase GluQRS n=1 Tax=Glaciecola punicea TaxID=56804 RepID=UPI0009F58219|nr:tRNA glutamyl-Q(34) synthetase GluQRS [Glaciecola punicea]
MTNAIRSHHTQDLDANADEVRPYRGRFAPSPTGPLHFGSLLCALASYLHAKQRNGEWLVRIEDIDTPRVEKDSTEKILSALQAHGLRWDLDIVFQSQRQHIYNTYLSKLEKANSLYACACTRSQIKLRSPSYDGYCRSAGLPFMGNSVRFIHTTNNSEFSDLFWGQQHINTSVAREDPVLRRADDIFCYHMAVVVDDIEQGITHIVRGGDLSEATPVQLSLYQALKEPTPRYMHIPMVVKRANVKLSKQRGAPAIDSTKAVDNLKLALAYLGMDRGAIAHLTTTAKILHWAIEHWQPKLMPKQSELLISIENDVYSAPQSM